MAVDKDVWDKAEIIARIVGALLIPTIIALSVYLWNTERSKLQTQATMTSIAVSILNTKNDSPSNQTLREWAAKVLQSPDNPPQLADEAVAALLLEGLTLFDQHTEVTKAATRLHAEGLTLEDLPALSEILEQRLGSGWLQGLEDTTKNQSQSE